MLMKKKGKAGNAALYMTRTQALKKLQVKLSQFRRLCILKGIFPREPKGKKPKGNNTYYHAKDIAFLQHEPLLEKFREMVAYEKKVRRALAKKNVPAAKRLASRRPQYQLDHLVRERYPSFVSALRDLDDPLTLVHLFAVLPAESSLGIAPAMLRTSRQLALEWQAWVVKAGALRKAFVSVKGFYFQADVQGQAVTWLVPHGLVQVLSGGVDYRVLGTFLDFYHTLLQFVNYRLYHLLGLRYPPRVDRRLEREAAELAAVMKSFASPENDVTAKATAAAAKPASAAETREMQRRLTQRVAELEAEVAAAAGASGAVAAPAVDEEEDEEVEIDSGDSAEEDEEEDEGEVSDPETEGIPAEAEEEMEGHDDDEEQFAAQLETENADHFYTEGVQVDPSDDSAVCSSIFKGLVVFLSREVPRELLMMTIRSGGGEVAWDGFGSPMEEGDERITHHVVDRPTQGHRFLTRVYVQPQWVWDSLNARVLAPTDLYLPGVKPPPHVSPFVDAEEEGYEPEYARRLRALRDAGVAAYRRAQGLEALVPGEAQAAELEAPLEPKGEDDVAAELAAQHAAEMAKELETAGVKAPRTPAPANAAGERVKLDSRAEEEAAEMAMAKTMMTRKTRRLFGGMQHGANTKRAKIAKLERRAATLAAAGTADAK